MFELNGKVAIVTGGAGGIGLEIATALLEAGATVVLTDIDEQAGHKAVQEIRSGRNGVIDFERLDVTDSAMVSAVMEAIVTRHGSLTILVNSAGILADGPIEGISDREWESVINVNLTGTFYCCREAVKRMEESGGGAIVNIASAGAKQGLPLAGVHYSATKAAILAMTRQIALQKTGSGIRANSVSPGTTATPMVERRSAEAKAFIVSQIPAGRMGKPEDTAAAVLFLVSDESRYITGENVDVNGGLYMD